MDLTLRKMLVVGLIGGLGMTVAACGDDGNGTETDTGSDAGPDTNDTSDDGTGSDAGTDGSGGGECGDEDPCTRARDCVGYDNPICEEGCCVEQPIVETCARHLAPCTSDDATTDSFICDTAAGLCIQRCASDEVLDTRGGNCPLGSYCFGDVDPAGPTDPTTGALLDGACVPGDCDGSIFDADACEGVASGDVTCTADTCTCLPIANGASFCISAGTAAEGEPCGLDTSDAPPASDSCEAGLVCFDNVCTIPCDLTADGGCGEGETCLEAIDTTTRNQPGICGVECEAFSAGDCGEGNACESVLGRFDINAWMCLPAGDAVAEGETCVSSSNSFAGNCAEGLLCLQDTEDGPSTCQAACDLTGRATGELASCGSDAVGPQLIAPFAFGEASSYITNAAGTYPVDIRTADGTLVTPATIEIVDGEVTSVVATIGDYAAGSLDFLAFTDLAAGESYPETGFRAIHASANAGDVDLFLTQLATVDFGDSARWTVSAGEGFIRTWNGADALLDAIAFDAASGTTTIAAIAPAPGGLAATTFDVDFAGLGDGDSRLTVYNATGESVDLYADEALVGTIAAFDTATADVASAEGTFDIFAADADPATDTALATVTVTPTGDAAHVIVFDGDSLNVSAAFTAPAAGDAALIAIHAVSGGPTVKVGFEGAAIAEDVAYGDAFGGDAGAFFEANGGEWALTVRGAGADATTDAALEGTFVADALYTFIATGDATSGLDLVAIEESAQTAPAAGSGSVRAIHAGQGAPAVAVHLQATSDLVCAPRFSLDSLPGVCKESCQPYPRTGLDNYPGCDDTADSCLPFAPQEEPTEAGPGGYCQPNDGDAAPFEACDNGIGVLGGGCADLAVCLSDEGTAEGGVCLPLCDAFGEGDLCGDATCSGVPPLLGSWELSFCIDDAQAGDVFGDCAEEGLPCAADSTLCLDIGDGPTCYPVCRDGFDDCADFDGVECVTGELNPDVVPTFMGLCH